MSSNALIMAGRGRGPASNFLNPIVRPNSGPHDRRPRNLVRKPLQAPKTWSSALRRHDRGRADAVRLGSSTLKKPLRFAYGLDNVAKDILLGPSLPQCVAAFRINGKAPITLR